MTTATLETPVELTELNQWVLHRSKQPKQVDGSPAKSNDPTTWNTYEAVADQFGQGGFDGFGFVFSQSDEFAGIDFDDVRDPITGEILPWAMEEISKLNSYAEVSPSGCGVKVWVKARLPYSSGKNRKIESVERIGETIPGVEAYDKLRFFVVTGERLSDAPTIVESRQSELDAFCEKYFAEPKPAPPTRQSNATNHTIDKRRIIERAEKYIAKMPPAISGEGGHSRAYHTAAVLVCGFDLSIDEAYPIFEAWSRTCSPPWSEKEIQHKLESAKDAPGERGHLLSNDNRGNGQKSSTVNEVVPQKGQPKAASEKTFAFHTATDFDGLDLHREYHIPCILAAGAVPTILAGAFKTLKTSIVMDLLISLATQHRFLDQFSITKRVKVAVMSGESGGFALQNLARRVAQSKGWSFPEIGDYFSICTTVPNLASVSDLQEIERFIVDNKIGVLCIDPTYLAMRSLRADEAGSVFAMGDLLEPLSKLAQRTSCTPLIVHHNTRTSMRNNIGEPAELADIAWSGFAEWAGQWILLARREKYDPDSDGEHRLWLTAGGRDGHSTLVGVNVTEGRSDGSQGRRWEVEVVDAGKARADAMEASQERRSEQNEFQKEKKADDDRDAILTVMRGIGDAETKTGIRERCGISTRRFDVAFAKLLGDGSFDKSEITKGNGRVYDAYKLQQTASDRNRPSDAVGCNRTATDHPPLRGGGSAAAIMPLDGFNDNNKNGLLRSDADGVNCLGNSGGDSF